MVRRINLEKPMDGTPQAPVERSAFHTHLTNFGGMHRRNPELVRLAKATGFSVEHLFKLATGQRKGSLGIVTSLATACKNKAVTVESFREAGAIAE